MTGSSQKQKEGYMPIVMHTWRHHKTIISGSKIKVRDNKYLPGGMIRTALGTYLLRCIALCSDEIQRKWLSTLIQYTEG